MTSVIYFGLSKRRDKKYVMIFRNPNKTIHFGQKYSNTYLDHNDDKIKTNYLKRHAKNENWNNPLTAGTLAKMILWNKKTLPSSFNDYLNTFNIIDEREI